MVLKGFAAALLCLAIVSAPNMVRARDFPSRLAIKKPIFVDLCSFDQGDWNVCTQIRRRGFSCDETLYFAEMYLIDNITRVKEFVIVCASKRPHSTLIEESGLGCVFVRFFHSVTQPRHWLPFSDDEFPFPGEVSGLLEVNDSRSNRDILSAMDMVLLDRKLEPCDQKELFPSYLGKRNEESIKKARLDVFERECRKRVLNCGPHWP
jgi:hypothetical protein